MPGNPDGKTHDELYFEAREMFSAGIRALDQAGVSKSESHPPAVDPDLMERLYKEVEGAYKKAGQRAAGHKIANQATQLLNVLTSKIADLSDRRMVDAAIAFLVADLCETLVGEAREPGSGKASA